jgi:hypothetical protein
MWVKGFGGGIWCKCCVHMCVNGKMRPVSTSSRNRGRVIKENGGGVDLTMIYLTCCKTFVNATMYATQHKKRKEWIHCHSPS